MNHDLIRPFPPPSPCGPFYPRGQEQGRTKPLFLSLRVILSCYVERHENARLTRHEPDLSWRRHATMSAAVCGKRSSSIFDELPLPYQPHHSAKRSRCGFSPPRDANPLLSHLRSLFPQMNQEVLPYNFVSGTNTPILIRFHLNVLLIVYSV
jgi:hypothetical protein